MGNPIDKLLSRDGVREFWIDNINNALAHPGQALPGKKLTHVIEASYVAKLEAALKVAMYHISWLAQDSKKYAGTDAWMSAKRAEQEIKRIAGGK